jgi:hypothetical protein
METLKIAKYCKIENVAVNSEFSKCFIQTICRKLSPDLIISLALSYETHHDVILLDDGRVLFFIIFT